MDMRSATNELVLGNISAAALPQIGLGVLASGVDSPSLRQLAVMEGCDSIEIERVFAKTIAELGIQMPSRSDAAMASARQIACDVLGKRLSPYDGAKTIWRKSVCRTVTGVAGRDRDLRPMRPAVRRAV